MTEADDTDRVLPNEDTISQMIALCNALITEMDALPSRESVQEIVDKVEGIMGTMRPDLSVTAAETKIVIRQLESQHDVRMQVGIALVSKDEDFEPWYDNALGEIEPYYFDRYRKYLEKEKGFSRGVVSAISMDTDKIISHSGNPKKDGAWDRRGMVLGHVQSGKTANYTGLVCKAADAGYKLIIVIAGMSSDLRNQTQSRLDEGFIGQESDSFLSGSSAQKIGVGNFSLPNDGMEHPPTFTSATKDFSKKSAEGLNISLGTLKTPVIFVIKKNQGILRNLIEWLRVLNTRNDRKRIRVPMILIDDEADNASINTKSSRDEVSRINGQIRELLELFERSTYVGYTATPFANIFIDPDSDDEMLGHDLFPRDFIYTMNPPDNYMGPAQYFSLGEPEKKYIRLLDDNGDHLPMSHKIDHDPVDLPSSLKEAIRTFVLGTAIRRIRGDSKKHSSMMINASRFVNVQNRLKNLVFNEWEVLKDAIRGRARLPDPSEVLMDPVMKTLHETWQREFDGVEFSWDKIRMHLLDTILGIKVISTNSRSEERLDYTNYPDGLHVIAIGGLSLSRGLTLEGLIVSYFLRNTKMYDTLMQMGRWFGYRPGYGDLCRVWLPAEALSWYRHIQESIEELREDLKEMVRLKLTPMDFGLKVRRHPSSLIITARNKVGKSERVKHRISLSGRMIETAKLRNSVDALDRNRDLATKFVSKIRTEASESEKILSGTLFCKVPVDRVYAFISDFQNTPHSLLTDPQMVLRYIDKRLEEECAVWDVYVPGVTPSDGLKPSRFGLDQACNVRTAGLKSNKEVLEVGNNQKISGTGIERVGLEMDLIADIKAAWKEEPDSSDKIGLDIRYRYRRTRPLIIIHELDMRPPKKNKKKLEDCKTDLERAQYLSQLKADQSRLEPILPSETVIGWSISFPKSTIGSSSDDSVEYQAGPIYMRQMKLDMDSEDEGEES